MKPFLLLFLMIISSGNNSSYSIQGKWKVQKVNTETETFIPEKRQYFLQISEKQIGYNLEVNSCFSDSFYIDQNQIRLYSSACTEICCDGGDDKISNYLNYSGNYILKDSVLTIRNKEAIIVLIKQ